MLTFYNTRCAMLHKVSQTIPSLCVSQIFISNWIKIICWVAKFISARMAWYAHTSVIFSIEARFFCEFQKLTLPENKWQKNSVIHTYLRVFFETKNAVWPVLLCCYNNKINNNVRAQKKTVIPTTMTSRKFKKMKYKTTWYILYKHYCEYR